MTLVERILWEAHWPDEHVEDDVRKLLDKTDDREMHYDLYGYPSDYLGTRSQLKRMQRESVIHSLVDGKEYFLFELMCFGKNDVTIGSAFEKRNGICRFNIRNRFVYLRTAKLKQLLLDHNEREQVVSGNKLLIRLPKQVLLDHADKLD